MIVDGQLGKQLHDEPQKVSELITRIPINQSNHGGRLLCGGFSLVDLLVRKDALLGVAHDRWRLPRQHRHQQVEFKLRRTGVGAMAGRGG